MHSFLGAVDRQGGKPYSSSEGTAHNTAIVILYWEVHCGGSGLLRLWIHSKDPSCLTFETNYGSFIAIIHWVKFRFMFTTSNLENHGSLVMGISDLMKVCDSLNNKGDPILVKQYGFKAGHLTAMQKIFLSCHTATLWCQENIFLPVCFIYLSENLWWSLSHLHELHRLKSR